ncbi:phosphate ABC transporter permease subunit PstC [Pseudoroseicyclus aestuarii]|uniref:Phosphate transport system permease protein n=1 Tax=Pseudoroseicyclus aestuarii TaxID=1795041 RepID=A0A318T0G4_9RHOB|nr:phosphate ABC transporter permease subunit PstC [Pseudoroseicyclus aestuarii]PYE86109.1 phosphate ABC transporter membrane protein 1 (PhoT family) [Pseudoroseicyclus aestuarii]
MSTFWIVLVVLAVAALCFVLARRRALSAVDGDQRHLHSRPNYYGFSAALWAAGPALIVLALWLALQPLVVDRSVRPLVLEEDRNAALVMSDVTRLAGGIDRAIAMGGLTAQEARGLTADGLRDRLSDFGTALASEVSPGVLEAAQRYRTIEGRGALLRSILTIGLAVGLGAFALWRVAPGFRARTSVERAILGALIAAACVAIGTTIGIVLSLIFNTIKFFGLYPAADFLFGTTWAPSFGGGSSLGILPLLWGTLYISLIALLVAVPIGLLAAIYLSEYAHRTVRAWAKPMLEVLAGIPTIVYGLFALLTVGPLLMDVFGPGGALGVRWMGGGTSVMTAGLVMGIMLIPFVSSLSDDIINAVPQSMRDGSLGLGATQSETVKQVILPAALPGIVGAVLLAASRAIGETMIVVLGAGAAARLDLNPFEAMTTVTAKIVSQLTGDADFSSPEALVAFALGMTLFVITLILNVFALWIVRRYREQYE